MIIKLAIALVVVLIIAAFETWAFLPARNLPGNRARHLRIRLHLRLHPGKGFAHVFSLWLRWSRFAVLRRSGQIRPALPWRYSLLDPGEHSVLMGRAHYRHKLRVPLEEHLLVMAPPRTYKTAFLAEVTDDLEFRRLEVRRYLEQQGILVLPETSFPLGRAQFEAGLDADLDRRAHV